MTKEIELSIYFSMLLPEFELSVYIIGEQLFNDFGMNFLWSLPKE